MESKEIPLDKFTQALNALLDGVKYSEDTGNDLWDFAVTIREIYQTGLNDTDLRWLTCKGYVEHMREVSIEGDDGRQFRRSGTLSFLPSTCFVLTERGVSVATQDGLFRKAQSLTPAWDATARRLHLEGLVVKRFKWPAMNQEAVLCAFQEEDWPDHIYDPLQPRSEQDPKRRLADTIKCLNRKQENELICFRGDGTGEGVVWERV